MHHPGARTAWSTSDHVSTRIFLVVASELVAVSGIFLPTICPSELNNGVCMVDNGVRITKEHYWVVVVVVWYSGVWCCVVQWCGEYWAGLTRTGLQAPHGGPGRR